MERTKALLASAVVAGTLMTGAVAYGATSIVTGRSSDNVGKLQPTAVTRPVTVVLDSESLPETPTTPMAPTTTVTVPPSTPMAPSPTTLGRSSTSTPSVTSPSYRDDDEEAETTEHDEDNGHEEERERNEDSDD